MSYWNALIVERVLRLERLEPALRHRERVVRELDLPGLLVELVHREVGDPAELEHAVPDEAELVAEARPRLAGERGEDLGHAADEEHGVAVVERKLGADRSGALGPEIVGDRAGALRRRGRRCSRARAGPRPAPRNSCGRRRRGCRPRAPEWPRRARWRRTRSAPRRRGSPSRGTHRSRPPCASDCADRACRCRSARSPRHRECAGTAASSRRGRGRIPRTRPPSTGSIAANTSSCVTNDISKSS